MSTRFERPLTHFVLASLGLLTLAFGGVVGSREFLGMAERVEDLEARLARAPLERRALEAELEGELEGVRRELAAVRAELDAAASAAETAALLSERVSGAETRLVDIAGAIEAHGSSLMVLKEASSTLAPTFEELLAEQAEEMSARWQGLEERVGVAETL